MSGKSSTADSFSMLHDLEKKLEKSKSLRERAIKKQKESQHAGESYKRCSPSPLDKEDSKRSKNDKRDSEPIFMDDDIDHDIPDRSFGDFYCKICDAHMNSEMAWETHIQGKRHLKNLRKEDLELKYDTLNEEPQVFSEINIADQPVAGLGHCCEYQRLEGRPTYQCFLCSANIPNGSALVEHLKGSKHMMAYLKEHDTDAHILLRRTQLSGKVIDPIIIECALHHRSIYGLGKMQVKRERLKQLVPSYYKPTCKDDFSHKMQRDDRYKYSERYIKKEFERDSKDSKDIYYEKEKRSRYYEKEHLRRLSDEETGHRRRSITPPKKSNYDHDHESSKRNSRRISSRDKNSFSNEGNSSFDKYNSSNCTKLSSSDKKEQHLSTQRSLTPPIPSQSQSTDISCEDLRLVLEQRKKELVLKESHSEYIGKILDVLFSLPNEVFLEIVQARVEQMNQITPSEKELSLLKTVGNMMLSIVMNQKINGLSPEMLNKFVEAVKGKATEAETVLNRNHATNNSNFSDLMKLIADLKSNPMPTSTSSNKPSSMNIVQSHSTVQNTQNDQIFATQVASTSQNVWNDKRLSFTYETKGIPGLTLSESSSSSSPYQVFFTDESAVTYPSSHYKKPQDPIGSNRNASSWPPPSKQNKNY